MKISHGLYFLFGLNAAASRAPRLAELEKRRDLSCTKYTTANSLISQCATATAFCTSYLGRPASTSTVYTSTSTKSVTLPAKTSTVTGGSTVTSTVTVFTGTKYVTSGYATVTYTRTVTSSDVNTATVTEKATETSMFRHIFILAEYRTTRPVLNVTNLVKGTQTITSVDHSGPTITSTVTVPDIPCSNDPQKRAALTKPPASCGVSTISSSVVSGACGCFLDRTTTAVSITTTTFQSTTTVTAAGSPSTVFTTITTDNTVTVRKTSTLKATVTKSVAVLTSVTTTNTDTITATETATSTETKTRTATETSAVPTCTPADINTYGNSTFRSVCDTTFVGYTRTVVDATDMYDCMSKCTKYNDVNGPLGCVAISFHQSACSNNCALKAGVDANDGVFDDKDWQSARMLSPALDVWGNTCRETSQEFGDIYIDPTGRVYSVHCGMHNATPNLTCYKANSEQQCFDDCASYGGNCVSTVSFTLSEYNVNCCPKYRFPTPSEYEVYQRLDVDSIFWLQSSTYY